MAGEAQLMQKIAAGALLPEVLHDVTQMAKAQDVGLRCSTLLLEPRN